MTLETDLIRLLPRKFRTIERLQDFLAECGKILDTVRTQIDGLADLFDPDNVSSDYVQPLADLLGYRVVRLVGVGSVQEEAYRRRVLKSIVDLIKRKGLKTGLQDLMYFFYAIADTDIYELYTNDYVEFWIPPSPGGDYYLSPHFVIVFPLDAYTRYSGGSLPSVAEGRELIEDLLQRLDEARPAHTVLHYDIGELPDFWRVGGPYNRVGVDLRVGGLVLRSV